MLALTPLHCRNCTAVIALQHCTVSTALQALHCKYCTAGTALQALHCIYCTAGTALQAQHCKHCTAGTALQAITALNTKESQHCNKVIVCTAVITGRALRSLTYSCTLSSPRSVVHLQPQCRGVSMVTKHRCNYRTSIGLHSDQYSANCSDVCTASYCC